MGTTTPLWQLLRSLCCNTPWIYAILWKLNLQSNMLTWENGYFDKVKSGKTAFGCKLDAESGNIEACRISAVVAGMSHHMYQVGEGVVGEIVVAETHLWVFAADLNLKLLLDCPMEWQPQFEAGIKTILLVPVIPLGIVQLGSLDMVIEDLNVVAHIKNLFSTEPTMWTSIGMAPVYTNVSEPSSPTKYLMGSEFSTLTDHSSDAMQSQQPREKHILASDIDQVDGDEFLAFDPQFFPLFTVEDDFLNSDAISAQFLETNMPDRPKDKIWNFPFDCELHKVLGLSSMDWHDDDVWSCYTSKTAQASCSPGVYEDLIKELDTCLVKNNSIEHIQDAVITNLYDDISRTFRYAKSCDSSSEKFEVSSLTQPKFETDILRCDDPMLFQFENFATIHEDSEINFSSQSSSKSSNMFLRDELKNKVSAKLHLASKKKGKKNDLCKPRPRDRQLIQDRVKELRGLIPNGSNCSIDGLLDRTVKHMLFLQNLSNQAEKVMHFSHTKVKEPGLTRNQTQQNRAYQLGRQPETTSPLIIEDLDQPGLLLVKVLCEEYLLFLEIAQVIRSIGLPILKGTMESKSGKLWAHFIIETSRGFHRMNILLPLMQLLQRRCASLV